MDTGLVAEQFEISQRRVQQLVKEYRDSGEFQSGKNDSDGEVVAFAMGAPRDSEDVRVPQDCPDCEHDNMRAIPGDDGFELECPGCGAELDG